MTHLLVLLFRFAWWCWERQQRRAQYEFIDALYYETRVDKA